MPRRLRLLAWCFLLLALAPVAPALARNVALVIGNGHYDTLPELANPNRDAIAVAGRLQDLGFKVTPVFDASAADLNRAADRFVQAARGADLALVYFAGHGVQFFDRNFLLGRDFDPAQSRRGEELGIDLSGLVGRLKASGAIRSAILVDACRDNPLDTQTTVALLDGLRPGAGAAPSGGKAPPKVVVASRGLAPIALPTAHADGSGEILMFFAAQPGAVSLDGAGQNSYFVEGLKQALARPNRPLTEVFRDASAYVRTATAGQQVPQIVSDWTADPALGAVSAAKVDYLVVPAGDAAELPDAQRKQLIAAHERGFRLKGDFIAHAMVSNLAKEEPEAKLGDVNGFSITYDLARSGHDQKIEVFFHQVDYEFVIEDGGVRRTFRNCSPPAGDEADSSRQAASVEVALRDINGDGRAELWIARDDGASGSWGTFCILEYKGIQGMAQAVRANVGLEYGDFDSFRTLLRGNAGWTVTVANDNSIRVCGGSFCASEWNYTYDGRHFTVTSNEGSAPEPPFADAKERAVGLFDSLQKTSKTARGGAWALQVDAAKKTARIASRVTPTSTFYLSCDRSDADPRFEAGVQASGKEGADEAKVDEVVLDYDETLPAVPMLVDGATCPVAAVHDQASKRQISLDLDASAGERCLDALGSTRTVTLPLLFGTDGLARFGLPESGAALGRFRAFCSTGRVPAETGTSPGRGPADSDVTGRVERFLTDVYFADATPSRGELEARYADPIAYFGKPSVPRDGIIRDKLRYYQTWPTHSFRLTPGSLVVTPDPRNPGAYAATFEFDYDLTAPGKHRGGHGSANLVLRPAGARWTILAEGGAVTKREAAH